MGFLIDVGLYCATQLMRAGARVEPKKLLSLQSNDNNADECAATMLRRYIYLAKKRLNKQPRTVHLPVGYAVANDKLQVLLDDVKEGNDLVPYQTKLPILRPSEIDRLLNRFNIQHFHIDYAGIKDGSGFYKRSDNLAFGIITETDFFFLDILSHKEADEDKWFFPKLLETIEKNWPHLLGRELKGITGWSINDNRLKDILAQNVNCAIELSSGRVVTGPNLGLGGDGISMALNREVDSILIDLKKYEQDLLTKAPGDKVTFHLHPIPSIDGSNDISFAVQYVTENGTPQDIAVFDNMLPPLRNI